MAILVWGGSGGSLHPAMTRPLVDRRDIITGQKLIRMSEFPATAQLSTVPQFGGFGPYKGRPGARLLVRNMFSFFGGQSGLDRILVRNHY